MVKADSDVCLAEINKRKAMEEKLKTEKARLDKDRKSFEEKYKSLELNRAKLIKKISELESMFKSERKKGVDRDILIEKQYFQVVIKMLSRRLSELSTSIMKAQRMKSDLHKRLNKAIRERKWRIS